MNCATEHNAKKIFPSAPNLGSLIICFLAGYCASLLSTGKEMMAYPEKWSNVTTSRSVSDDSGSNRQSSPPDGLKQELRLFNAKLPWSEVAEIVAPWTMVSENRLELIYNEVRDLNARGVKGDIVECGVWAGGASLTMLYAQLSNGSSVSREFWMFDTYDGLPRPDSTNDGEKEKEMWDSIASGKMMGNRKKSVGSKWNYAPLALVQAVLSTSGYPSPKLHFIQGKVEETVPRLATSNSLPTTIALLRLDTDWYDSTRAEIEMLYDRLAPGGLLVVDDYCTWGGSTKAINEFYGGKEELSKLAIHEGMDGFCLALRKPIAD